MASVGYLGDDNVENCSAVTETACRQYDERQWQLFDGAVHSDKGVDAPQLREWRLNNAESAVDVPADCSC